MDIYVGHEPSESRGGMNDPLIFYVLAAFALVPLAFPAAVVWFAVTKRRSRFRCDSFAFQGVLL
jgi:hypothetical protein